MNRKIHRCLPFGDGPKHARKKCSSWNSQSEIEKSKIQAKKILKATTKIILKVRSQNFQQSYRSCEYTCAIRHGNYCWRGRDEWKCTGHRKP